MAPSLPIKLVFLSPPALPAPLTGGAAAAAARTMGPRVPAPGTGRRHRRTGPCRRHSFLPRPLEYSGTRAGREVLPRHRLQRTLPEEPPVPGATGGAGRRDEPRPGGERGGVRQPLSRTSQPCPGSFSLLPALWAYGCRPGTPGHRSPGGPPGGEGTRLVVGTVGTHLRCLLRVRGARTHEGSPGGEAMLPQPGSASGCTPGGGGGRWQWGQARGWGGRTERMWQAVPIGDTLG